MSNNTSSNSSDGEFRKYQLIPLSIIIGVGFLANSMVIFNGIRRRTLIKHYSNYFVLSMAVADWCVVTFAIPVVFIESLWGFHKMNTHICAYVITMRETFQGAAIFSIATLAILRARQVMTNPLKQFSKRICRRLVAAIWIISFLVCTTPFFHVYKVYKESGKCDPAYANPLRAKIHLTFIMCILISPMLIATIAYGIVIIKVTNLIGSNTNSVVTKRNRSIAVLLILLILSCWISYTPLGLYLLINVHSDEFEDVNNLMWHITTILFFGGSALNPILVLLSMPRDYYCNVECRRERRVGVEEPRLEQKEILESSFPLQGQNMSQQAL
jgi:hypothetical protein